MTRVALCTLADLPVGLGRPFEVGGVPVAVFHSRDGKVFAVQAECPHKGGPLADGMLAGDQVVCPYHSFRFQRDTGECDMANVCALKTYPTEVEDGDVFVTV
jgi:nitrite reductase (NADH) small subunit